MKIYIFISYTLLAGLLINHSVTAQFKGYRLDFNDNTWVPAYNHQDYTVLNQNKALYINANAVGTNYQNIVGVLPDIDLTLAPKVFVKLRSQNTLKFELRVLDKNGKETNNNNPTITVAPQSSYIWVTLDFTNKFTQSWPAADVVDPASISKFSILINSGGNPDYSGWIEIDEIIFGDSNQIVTVIDPVVYQPKVNQLGYYTACIKAAVIPSAKTVSFAIIDEITGDTIYRGTSSIANKWPYSEEMVIKADFSSLQTAGTYRLYVKGLNISYPFVINDGIYDDLLKASIKGFYYQRASTDIPAAYGGVWSRAAGHPDNKVLIHSSAASTARPEGTEISSPKGWYDAGDYNKYVVPAGIATWQLLSSYEYFNTTTGNLNLNIPESSNTIPDILDEALWEIQWLRSMQDPNDGGVYHKLTNSSFDGSIMPDQAILPRYVVQKSTAAALDFASILAKASRLYQNYPELNSQFSDSCLAQAEAAWDWAILNPAEQYDQSTLNSSFDPDIVTGDYGLQSYNIEWKDEWLWAAVELYIATGKTKYLNKVILNNVDQQIPNWSNVQFLGIIALIKAESKFPSAMVTQAKNLLLQSAQTLVASYQQSAYGTIMGVNSNDYLWNSNGTAANQAGILLHAYELTHDGKYFNASLSNIDYLLGKNPVNYSFVTGFGAHSPLFPHQRLSAADGIQEPIPGFLVNGPHNDYVSECYYTSTIPAFTYQDNYCSSATNEVSIYCNSALVYALSATKEAYSEVLVSGLTKTASKETLKVFPNPNDGRFDLKIPEGFENGNWQLIDLNGKVKQEGEIKNSKQITVLSKVPSGVYILKLLTDTGSKEIRVVIL